MVVDIDPSAEPCRAVVIGPDQAGSLMEMVVLELAGGRLLAIHAVPSRPAYHDLLGEGDDG